MRQSIYTFSAIFMAVAVSTHGLAQNGQSQKSGTTAANDEAKLMASGIVFEDTDSDRKFTSVDKPLAGVRVSNGVDIVKTDEKGRYELSVDDDTTLFLIKPSGYRTVLSKDNLPRFYYIHKPDGSPELRFPGVKPTGNLPESIDFPLYAQNEPSKFKIILFADPQSRNVGEVGYVGQDVVSELVGSDAAFGVTLGDIVFDDLTVFDSQNQTVGMIGIPWYNIIGNHDINFDARNREHANETFERVYGPSYYSFDYGHAHFIVMDNIDWYRDANRGNDFRYRAGFGEKQLEFVKKDLEQIPEDQPVILMMHIPLKGAHDRQELYRIIEKRPFCISFSGHTHTHEHEYIDKSDGWNGPQPHKHLICATVSGSWWSGQKDERGIPHTTMRDGGPNGYTFVEFDGENYDVDFKAAGRSKNYQMQITLPNVLKADDVAEQSVYVNVFNGGPKSKVEMQIRNVSQWKTMERINEVDPGLKKIWDNEQKVDPKIEPPLSEPRPSTHLWRSKLADKLEPGNYLIEIRTTEEDGDVLTGYHILRVEK